MLVVDHVSKSFGAKRVLDDLVFAIKPGEMFGFCGANGAGKTTTMRVILGLLTPEAGQVTWNGTKVDREIRRTIGYMPEERGLYPKMRPVDQLQYFGQLHGMTAASARKSAEEWIERLGVKMEAKDPLDKLSLGNQQKVQLASALVFDPAILVLDEPFSGLDPVAVDALADGLLEKAKAGVPVIFSSHQLDLVERLCDSVGIINNGTMVATGPVDELRAKESRKRLEIVITGAQPGWTEQLSGVSAISETGTRALMTPDSPEMSQQILAEAMKIGPIERFGWRTPPLTEIFREAIVA
ncbi:MAG: ATP-binding cassette domain-containing protein [Antricoccus sp.]